MKTTFNFLIIFTLILLSNIIYSQSVPSYVPTNGLVGWWGFNGNAQDGSGNGNHGTVNGATLTTDRFGNQNGAYLSNSNSMNSITGSCSNFPSGNSPRTISIWYNASGLGSGCCKGLFGYGGGGCGNSLNLGFENHDVGAGKFEIQGHCQAFRQVMNYPLPANNFWHNVLISYDANSILRFYFNGQLSYTSTPVSLNTDVSGKIFNLIGEVSENGFSPYYNTLYTPFNGKLDDIGIWNRALSQQEITNLYNSQLPTQSSLCLPTITTTSPSSFGMDSSVVIGGNITNDGGSSIVLRGVCYSTSPNPNMGNQRTQDGSGIGSFNTVLRGLTPTATYYARSYAKNSNGVVVYGNEVSFTITSSLIGSSFEGGIVFYIDSTGQHGLVCAPSDQGSFAWGCTGTDIGYLSAMLLNTTGFGSGQGNTNLILSWCSQRPIAASICDNLVLNGYSDWFLPSLGELQLMYSNLRVQGIGGFSNNWYWSSSQYTPTTAWGGSFDNGNGGAIMKYDYNRVRAVRAF